MAFTNPLVAGGFLKIPAVRSVNYVEGVSGWSIEKDGTSQLGSVHIIGDAGADTFSADAITIAGDDLSYVLDHYPRGIRYRGRLTIDSAAVLGATEVSIFQSEIPNMLLNHTYRFHLHYRITGTIAADSFRNWIRYTTDGTTPSLTSGAMDNSGHNVTIIAANKAQTVDYSWTYWPLADRDVVKMIFTVFRASGTGTCQILGTDVNYGVMLVCEDIGLNDDLTTTISQFSKSSGSADGAPLTTYVKKYYATDSQSYNGDLTIWGGSDNTTDHHCHQGYYSSNHTNVRSIAIFNSAQIVTDLTGATVNSVKLTYKMGHAYWYAGIKVRVGGHNYTSTPSPTINMSNVFENQVEYSANKVGATYTKTLPAAFGTNLKSGTWKGICFGPGGSGSAPAGYDWYGWVYGFESGKPYLTISYTK